MIGEAFAVIAAFCYALGSVAATLDARENGGRGTAVMLSICLTTAFSGLLWLWIGPPLPRDMSALWKGTAYFALAGLLATVLGRVLFFRSVELIGAVETSVLRRLIPVFAVVMAVVFLDERITPTIAAAFGLVFAGIAIVLFGTSRGPAGATPQGLEGSRDSFAGRAMAVGSAASYGGSFVTRKFGMAWLPDPLAGTFIGSVTGLALFCSLTPFNSRFRAQVAGVLRRPTRYQGLAAGSISLGQIAQFVALKFTSVTAVAIISSLEMFFAAWLAGFVIRSEPRPGLKFVAASALAFAGIVVLSLGRSAGSPGL
ncbi:DMT family transporter (plasmid) [Roseivivax marinus]|uniref:DMT family transporter n=1 Tax=Roseivivax marinus TaxID=1379903 RepID=UPI001F049583|nr:DMT family transporter [Roseivivax marinus]UMA67144.1 DMT family transporter [Roseivivax marinus]